MSGHAWCRGSILNIIIIIITISADRHPYRQAFHRVREQTGPAPSTSIAFLRLQPSQSSILLNSIINHYHHPNHYHAPLLGTDLHSEWERAQCGKETSLTLKSHGGPWYTAIELYDKPRSCYFTNLVFVSFFRLIRNIWGRYISNQAESIQQTNARQVVIMVGIFVASARLNDLYIVLS